MRDEATPPPSVASQNTDLDPVSAVQYLYRARMYRKYVLAGSNEPFVVADIFRTNRGKSARGGSFMA